MNRKETEENAMGLGDLKVVTSVDVRKQLKPSQYVSFEGAENDGLRVLFVGNSITLHGPNPDIGWYYSWGMAASAREKDYVHLCHAHIRQRYPDAVFGLCQVGMWEHNYRVGDTVLEDFAVARDFAADVIIIKLAGNCPVEGFEEETFAVQFAKLVEYLNPTGKAKVIVSTEFYRHPAEAAQSAYAEANGHIFCVISDLSFMPEMYAHGLFEHEGVANHPGDRGMAAIAERYCAIFDRLDL